MIENKDVSCSCSLIEGILREIAREDGRDEDEFVREVRMRFNGGIKK